MRNLETRILGKVDSECSQATMLVLETEKERVIEANEAGTNLGEIERPYFDPFRTLDQHGKGTGSTRKFEQNESENKYAKLQISRKKGSEDSFSDYLERFCSNDTTSSLKPTFPPDFANQVSEGCQVSKGSSLASIAEAINSLEAATSSIPTSTFLRQKDRNEGLRLRREAVRNVEQLEAKKSAKLNQARISKNG